MPDHEFNLQQNSLNQAEPPDITSQAELPDIAYGIGVLGLEGMGPARLERLKSVAEFNERKFTAVWEFIIKKPTKQIAHIAGVKQETAGRWKQQANDANLEETYSEHSDLEISINPSLEMPASPSISEGKSASKDSSYPERLMNDPEPPLILFSRGVCSMSEIFSNYKTVGIVGTRNCSRYGADIAYSLGRQLCEAGIVVVSGLALGIDFASHSGSTEARQINSSTAPSVAIVGNGLDIVYPRRSKKLYEAVSGWGAVISEAPLHAVPQKWRFPSRNRIIAGLSDVLVVVESHLKGGSLITAEEAGARGKTILAVPGSIHSPASSGTNRLIADGCQPYLEIEDVFMALDFVKAGIDDSQQNIQQNIQQDESEASLSSQEQLVLDAFCWEAVSHQLLLQRTGIELEKLSYLLESLIQKGWVARRGIYMERVLNPHGK